MLFRKQTRIRDASQPGGEHRSRWTVVGLLAGVACGLVFGEYCSGLSLLGEIYIGLLRMTVLPYIVVALISNLGRLTLKQSSKLGAFGGTVLAALWGIGLYTIYLVAHSFPRWKAGSFFSTVMTDPVPDFSLIDLFIPANIFASLAENQVPAVVVLCISLGLALTTIGKKQLLIDQLDILAAALIRISNFVVRFTPIGVFAIAAHTLGTLSWSELGRLQAYLIAYTAATLILMLFVLPWMITIFTPFGWRDVWRVSRVALLTAFATGKLIIVLPILVQETEKLFAQQGGVRHAVDRPAVDVLYPLAYPFPHLGKLMGMLFIPFAAWFLGRPMRDYEFPAFLLAGLFSYFGGPILATPFLLDQMHLPHDMFQLFVLSGVYCGRLGDALGVMHLVAFALLTTSAFNGTLRLQLGAIGKFIGVTSLLAFLLIVGLKQGLKSTLKYIEPRDKVIANMQLLQEPMPYVVLSAAQPNPDPLLPGEDLLTRIRRRGVIRIGYNDDSLPFAYFNSVGDLVGFDINMAHVLARDLGVTIEFVWFDRGRLAQMLRDDCFDVVMSGVVGTLDRAEVMQLTDAYMDVTLAIVAPDYRVRDFASLSSIRQQDRLKFGYVGTIHGFADRLELVLPNVEWVELPSNQAYFTEAWQELDGLLTSAESGSAYSLLYPDFEVIVPRDVKVSLPLVYAVGNRDEAMSDFLEHWLELRERDGTMQEVYDYWILGKTARKAEPRWSLIRHLGWVQ